MKTSGLLFAAFFFVATLAFPAQETKTMSLPAEGIQALRIDCGAGFLKVQGGEGLTAIEVKAEIYAGGAKDKDMEEFIKDRVKLSLEQKGNRAILVSEIKSSHFFFSFREARIDLTVSVPKNLDLDIDDGSGSIEVRDIVGDISLDDGSGEIQIENVQGNLKIDDGSGEIEVRDVSGDVLIDDGSGEITVNSVGGNVTVSDGSGSINIQDVEKDVILKETGSGGENISNVKGRVIK